MMELHIPTKAKVHLAIFAASILALIHFSHDPFLSMVIVEISALYVITTNRQQRELLPALSIIVFSKILTLPLTLNYYSPASVKEYLVIILLYDLGVALALQFGYRANGLRKLFNVTTPARKIPQVLAMCTLLYLGIFHIFLVLSEILIWEYDHQLLSSEPFFYGSFEAARTFHKLLLLLAIWSMLLDSHFVDYDRYKKLTPSNN